MVTGTAQRRQAHPPEATMWRPVDGLVIEEIGDEYLVLNKARGRIHQFNFTAGLVWRGIMNQQSLDEISKALMDRFEVPDYRARRDALKMIDQLKILKLITDEQANEQAG